MVRVEHAAARRSRQLIREAFLTEVAERDLDVITVTDVVRRAGVNRSTFYAHYSNVAGLLAEFEGEILEMLRTALRKLRYPEMYADPEPALRYVADFLAADADAYRTLLLARGSEVFVRELEMVFADHMRSDASVPASLRASPAFDVRVAYFTGGIVNLFCRWLLGDISASADDMIAEIAFLIRFAHAERAGARAGKDPTGGLAGSRVVSSTTDGWSTGVGGRR